MDNITDVTFGPCTTSRYVQPVTMHYTQNGAKKTWDLLGVHDGVTILIFNSTRKVFLFVKQFRPPVYFNAIAKEDRNSAVDTKKYPGSLGITLELCGGLVDKSKTLEEIAQDEVFEECGYKVPLENVHKITTFISGVGTASHWTNFFYVEVTDDMHIASGGGVEEEGELIEVVEMSVDEAYKYIHQEQVRSPPICLYALTWFFFNKKAP